MGFDIGVLDDEYRYMRHLHIDKAVYSALFRKLVTEDDYPSLGKAKDDSEDITFTPGDIPALMKDITNLEKYLRKEKLMSEEVKGRCMDFLLTLKEICQAAKKRKKNVEFVAGE